MTTMTVLSGFYISIQWIGAVVLVGSTISTALPAPLSSLDAVAHEQIPVRIRKSKVYLFFYKLCNACALNVGWAKNLADPRSKMIIQQMLSMVATLISRKATQAAAGSLVATSDITIPVLPSTENGSVVVSDALLDTVAQVATEIANAATQAALNK